MSKGKGFGAEALKLLKAACWQHRIKMVWSRPLAKGIYGELLEALPKGAISNKKLYAALCYHTNTLDYLVQMKAGSFRLSAGGIKAQRITKPEALHALELLNKRKKAATPKRATPVKVKVKRTGYGNERR